MDNANTWRTGVCLISLYGTRQINKMINKANISLKSTINCKLCDLCVFVCGWGEGGEGGVSFEEEKIGC